MKEHQRMYYPIYSAGAGMNIIKNKTTPKLRRNLFLCFPLECQILVGTESQGASPVSTLKNTPIGKSNRCILCSHVVSIIVFLYKNVAHQSGPWVAPPTLPGASVVLFQWPSHASPQTPQKGKETRDDTGPQVRMLRTNVPEKSQHS